MARTINRLTSTQVTKAGEGLHADGDGLYLKVDGGVRSWIFRYVRAGIERKVGLGPVRDVMLSEARGKAREMRALLREGLDPQEVKRSQQSAGAVLAAKGKMTFDQAAAAYMKAHAKKWTNRKHHNQWVATLAQYVSPVVGKLAVSSIDTTLVIKILTPIWTDKNVTANRVRQRVEAVLDWSKAMGYRDDANPARWDGHLEYLLPARKKGAAVQHYDAIRYTDAGQLMAELRQDGTFPAMALQFLLLCASRTEEVRGARWEEIDFIQGIWTVPGERMKGRTPHRVPLSGAAMAILQAMRKVRSTDRVFPAMRIDRVMSKFRPGSTVHGLRSTFRTWVAERTEYPRELAEAALAHLVGSEVERSYQRSDQLGKRREMMEAWAAYVSEPHRSGEVIELQRRPAQ